MTDFDRPQAIALCGRGWPIAYTDTYNAGYRRIPVWVADEDLVQAHPTDTSAGPVAVPAASFHIDYTALSDSASCPRCHCGAAVVRSTETDPRSSCDWTYSPNCSTHAGDGWQVRGRGRPHRAVAHELRVTLDHREFAAALQIQRYQDCTLSDAVRMALLTLARQLADAEVAGTTPIHPDDRL